MKEPGLLLTVSVLLVTLYSPECVEEVFSETPIQYPIQYFV